MKGLWISAFTTAVLALGASAVSTAPANAYSPPSYVTYEGYHYYLSSYYDPSYCIYETFYYHQYTYCRHHSSGYSSGYNSGGSSY